MASESKKTFVEELTADLKGGQNVIVTDYQGMNAAEFDELRSALRPLGATYQVVKNRLAKIALKNSGFGDLGASMKGPSALTYKGVDGAKIVKTLFGFAEKHSTFKVRAGFIMGQTADAPTLRAISALPSRDVLMATLAARLNGPLQGFVSLLNEPLRSLHGALSALANKKEPVA